MAKYLLLAVAIAVMVRTAAAAERPYLVPIDGDLSVLAAAPGLQAYHVAARDALVGAGGSRTWEAVVFPSFQREWAVYVEKPGTSGTHQLVCTRMKTQLWGQMESAAERASDSPYAERQLAALQKADKGIQRSASPISASTEAALEGLWSAMLSQARAPTEPPRCIDGTSYCLFEWSKGVRSRGGWGRCPQKDTPPAAGLALLQDLCSAASNAERGKLAQTIAQLHRSLK